MRIMSSVTPVRAPRAHVIHTSWLTMPAADTVTGYGVDGGFATSPIK
jgi:hypothetical protein